MGAQEQEALRDYVHVCLGFGPPLDEIGRTQHLDPRAVMRDARDAELDEDAIASLFAAIVSETSAAPEDGRT